MSLLEDRKNQIHTLEILAVAWALTIFRDHFSGHLLIVFIDNQSALGMVRKGVGLGADHASLASGL